MRTFKWIVSVIVLIGCAVAGFAFGYEFPRNVFRFYAAMTLILGALTIWTEAYDELAKNPLPAWRVSTARYLDFFLMLFLAGFGEFPLALVWLTSSIFKSVILKKAADVAARKEGA